MLNLLGYTFTVLAAWSAIDHEYVAAVAFAVAAVAAPSPSPSRRRAEMTIARYVDIAQRPDRHTVEELTAAMELPAREGDERRVRPGRGRGDALPALPGRADG